MYRVFAESGELLYVGSTNSVHTRLADHAQQQQPWFPLAHRVEVEEFTAERDARSVERLAIRNEDPLGNVVWTGRQRKDTPTVDPRIERLLQSSGVRHPGPLKVKTVTLACGARVTVDRSDPMWRKI